MLDWLFGRAKGELPALEKLLVAWRVIILPSVTVMLSVGVFISGQIFVGDKLGVFDEHVVGTWARKDFCHDGHQIQYEECAEDHEELKRAGHPFVASFAPLVVRGIRCRLEDDFIEPNGFLHRIKDAVNLLLHTGNRGKEGLIMALQAAGLIRLQRGGVLR